MAQKYVGMSPYNYCVGNPVMLVDPDGNDIWEVDSLGVVQNIIPDETEDLVRTVDSFGEIVGESLVYKKGTIQSTSSIGDVFKFTSSNSVASSELFSYLAKSSKVEYALIETVKQHVVFTDGFTNKIDMVSVAVDLENSGQTIKTFVHSHPRNTLPSGYVGGIHGDRLVALLYEESRSHVVNHFVYAPKYNRFIQYDYHGYYSTPLIR